MRQCTPWFASFLLLLSTVSLSAQLAPDFTITDSDGQPHSLYADYLNQGKTVLIEIFFTTCPPCNAIAPYMEPLYEEWGSGDYDVEFFDLSDKNFDTDVLVNNYKMNYGHTYPAAGVEGGSLAAVAPYKQGMFGPFYGTPTFVVIAPDGTVQYDIEGGNNAATIAEISAAIAATGAEMPECVNTYAVNESICPGESVQINGQWYDTPGTYTDLIEVGNGGCDSLLWITITEMPLVTATLNASFCEDESVVVYGTTYSAEGTYEILVPSVTTGCDTLLTLHVTELPYNTRTINASFCEGGFVVVHGTTYFEEGTYEILVPAATTGCDTILTIHIAELSLNNKAISASFDAGDSVQVYGQWYSMAGVFLDTVQSVTTACDTIITLTITENSIGPEDVQVGGVVRTFGGAGIAGAIVIARNSTGIEETRDTTNAQGQYGFIFDAQYFANNPLSITVHKSSNPYNGVSVLDLVALQKHLLGLLYLDSTEKLFAADVNNSATLSALDILLLRKLLLGLVTHFPSGDSWIFFHDSVDLGPPDLQLPVIEVSPPVLLQNIHAGSQSPVFRGVKLGDLNHSANPLD